MWRWRAACRWALWAPRRGGWRCSFWRRKRGDAAWGGQLLEEAIARYGVEELTVNEQNPDAVGFYEHLGFRTYKRTELDEEGRPYPLLYMRREATQISND